MAQTQSMIRRTAATAAGVVRRWRRTRAVKRRGRGSRLSLALLAGLLVLLGAFAAAMSFLYAGRPPGQELRLDEVISLADHGRLSSVVVENFDDRLIGTFRQPGGSAAAFHAGVPTDGQAFQTLLQHFRTSHTHYTIDTQSSKKVVTAVSTFLLPLMILADLFALLFAATRGGGSAIGEVSTFGTIGKGNSRRGQSTLGFADVGGADEAVAELREVRDYLVDPARYEALGAAPPKGVLLFGPPGTGKTLLAKAVAGEAGVPFFSVAGAEFVESLVGVGAARVRDLFARVRAAAPAIVFIDELDAAGRKRGGGAGGGSDEREQTLNQLLVEMDGFEVSQGVVVIGATNRPDILDPALMRPGRFDRHITIERPEVDGRVHILTIHARNKPLGPDVDLAEVARRTPGFTGADLANVLNEATLLAIRDGRGIVDAADIEEAIFRVQHGPKRRGRVLSEEERWRAAHHEAAHAVVLAAQGELDLLQRVTILGSAAVGVTQTLRPDDAVVISQAQLSRRLVALLAGRAGETLAHGDASTGCESDLKRATDIARAMVGRFGFSSAVGPVRLLSGNGATFLDEEMPVADLSGEAQAVFDAEVRRLLETAAGDAAALLQANRDAFDLTAMRLHESETLDEIELLALLDDVRPIAVGTAATARKATTRAVARS